MNSFAKINNVANPLIFLPFFFCFLFYKFYLIYTSNSLDKCQIWHFLASRSQISSNAYRGLGYCFQASSETSMFLAGGVVLCWSVASEKEGHGVGPFLRIICIFSMYCTCVDSLYCILLTYQGPTILKFDTCVLLVSV